MSQGLMHSPKQEPRAALKGDTGPLGEDPPLDCNTASVALQQSRILCCSAQRLASLRWLARRSAPSSRFECYKPSLFDRTATEEPPFLAIPGRIGFYGFAQ